MPSTPSGNTGTATATNHGLNTSDFVDVTGATPAAYNVSDAAIIKIDANTFTYGLSAAAGTSSSGQTVFGKKLVQALTAVATTATVTLPSHGYSALTQITISGVTNDPVFNGTFTITSATTNTFTYSLISPSTLAGTTARATSAGHGFSSGQSVTIAGATPSAYNGTYTITVLDASTFTYALSSGQSVSATGAITASSTVTNNVTSITHPTSGSATTQSTATVTTGSAHGFAAGDTVTIANAAQSAYNGTFTVSSVVNPTQFRFISAAVQTAATPATVASGQTSITVSKTTTRNVTALNPAVTATGTILSSRRISPISITVQTNATGQILAGRKSDPDAAQRDNIINWVRGQDNKQDENSNASTTDIRASLHGDVLHSRPAVVNYNRGGANGSNTGDNDVFVYYGTNDGVFRAVQGGGIPTAANPSPPANSTLHGSITSWPNHGMLAARHLASAIASVVLPSFGSLPHRIMLWRGSQLVTGLETADFEVREDKKPQKVDTFEIVKIDAETNAGIAPKAIRSTYDEESEARQPNVRLFILLLDDYHVRRGNDLAVRKPLMDFVQQGKDYVITAVK